MTKVDFENWEFCPKSIKIEFTILPESASFDNVLYNPFIESNMIRWGSIEIFVRIFGRISVIFDSTVLNKLRLGIAKSCDFTYPEKRKSKSTNKTGRVCFFTISWISFILENAFSYNNNEELGGERLSSSKWRFSNVVWFLSNSNDFWIGYIMNFDSISEDFQTDKIYLNNASVSVMPKISIEAMKQFLVSYLSLIHIWRCRRRLRCRSRWSPYH